MRLDSLRLQGFSPAFPGVVDLPFRDIPPGLIAIVGSNGAGKTTLLETTPAAIFRMMPSNDGADPVTYAQSREAFLDLAFTFDEVGSFRARLNLDGGQKRKTDAVLEAVQADGSRVPLSDGKVTTYDAAIRSRFPSFDLFINSAFAAQGRGDEFTRRAPSKRKELFYEFLALQHYGVKARTALDAADLVSDARLRLTVEVESLERDTAEAIVEALDQRARELLADGGAAELRQAALRTTLQDLEARSAMLADQVAAFASATHRVTTLERELTARRDERAGLDRVRTNADETLSVDRIRLTNARDEEVRAAAAKIAGNQKLQGMKAQILAAVEAMKGVDQQLAAARAALSVAQADRQRGQVELQDVERQLAALAPIAERFTRSKTDAGLLESVPCGGQDAFAACQFLVNATAANARIADLEAQLRPKAELADQIAGVSRQLQATQREAFEAQELITRLEGEKTAHEAYAKYQVALADSDARIEQLTAGQQKAEADAARLIDEAVARRDVRVQEIDASISALNITVGRLVGDLNTAKLDLTTTAEGNTQAADVQRELDAARREWDYVTATIARVTSLQQELEHRRHELTAKRERLEVIRGRLAQVEQLLVEWKDLAKALTKLPEIEIDNAGPTISARTNELLASCFGPRFTLELVTQVQKADGSGMKDDFTVRVIDNEKGGDWRDIRAFSGGQRTILQEALMCAISLYVNERSPLPIRTLWRDETGAALDAENAIAYVQMLRRVRELGNLHHVFFISHNAEAAALADAQIQVRDGQASIVYPPFSEAA